MKKYYALLFFTLLGQWSFAQGQSASVDSTLVAGFFWSKIEFFTTNEKGERYKFSEGYKRRGKACGLWKKYDEQGRIVYKGHWKNDKRVHTHEYFTYNNTGTQIPWQKIVFNRNGEIRVRKTITPAF